jgi:hypothetical protein
MQIRIIIEHKYSYSHQNSVITVRKEKREFCIQFCKSREKHQNFKNPSKIKGYR